MTKGEARAARKSGLLLSPQQQGQEEQRRLQQARKALRKAQLGDGMYRWARAYDELDGAPESEEDR